MRTETVRVSEVKVPAKRHRSLNMDAVKSLQSSIAKVGLMNAITVREDMTIIAGVHRLKACALLGHEEIQACVLDVDDLEAELAEIDENLIRNELTQLEEARHLARRKEIYEALHPQTKKGGDRSNRTNEERAAVVARAEEVGVTKAAEEAGINRDTIYEWRKVSDSKVQNEPLNPTPKPSFVESVSSELGIDESTAKRKLQIATIPEDILEDIEGTKLEDSQTDLLAVAREAKKDTGRARRIVEKITSGEAKNAAAAKIQINREEAAEEAREKAKAKPVSKRLGRVINGSAPEVIMGLGYQPNLVITDPPYGIEVHNTRNQSKDYADGEDYALTLLDETAAALAKKCAPDAHLYFFSGYTYAFQFKEILARHFDVQDNPLIWVKDNATMANRQKKWANRHEYIWFCKQKEAGDSRLLMGNGDDVLIYPRQSDTNHSAEKPVELLKRLIEMSGRDGDIVLDPFCGSGATGVATVSFRRVFLGIELDSEWAEFAENRINAA